MYKVSYQTFMVYRCSGVDNTMSSYAGTRLYHSSLHHYRAFTNFGLFRYNGRGMNRHPPSHIQLPGNFPPYLIVTDADNQRSLHLRRPEYRISKQLVEGCIVIKQSFYRYVIGYKDIYDHLGMSTGSV